MQISFENHDLFDSKTFITDGSNSFTVTLGSGLESLRFVYEFVSTEGKTPLMNTEKIDDKAVKIILQDWDHALGASLVDIVKVGTMNHRELLINFDVQKMSSRGSLIVNAPISPHFSERSCKMAKINPRPASQDHQSASRIH